MPTMGTIVTRAKEVLTSNGHTKLTQLEPLMYRIGHKAILKLARKFPKAGEWRGRETVSVSGQTVTATLKFLTIESVFNVTDDWPLVERDEPELEAVEGQNQTAREPRYYSERGELTLELDVVPATTTNIEIKGWVLPTELDSNTGSGSDPPIGELWHGYVEDSIIAKMALQQQNPDLSRAYQADANDCLLDFAKRIQRKLSEQGNIVQTYSEHLLAHRVNRRRRRLWD